MAKRMMGFVIALFLTVTVQASPIEVYDQSSFQIAEVSHANLSFDLVESGALSTPQDCESTFDLETGQVILAAACCKTCKKGKACGDSCISRDKKCHKPKGCACDG